MNRSLIVHRAGPGVSVQDLGRAGYLAFGLSRGGAADRLALYEGAALLGQSETLAALELASIGGEFEASEDIRIALTGGRMRALVDGEKIAWNASYMLTKGQTLSIGAAEAGSYGYLHIGGGIATPEVLGGRSSHQAAGLGASLVSGQHLAIGADTQGETGMTLVSDTRYTGGTVRIVKSLQTDFFAPSEIARFEATEFRRDTRGNRMGVRVLSDGQGFKSDAGLSVLSEVIVPGDIQITGDGTPFVLLSECQTTGGYPRIGSVLPADLPKVAQAQPGATLRFVFVSLSQAVEIERREKACRGGLRGKVEPLIRDPRSIPDLLSYQLIGGMSAGDEFEKDNT
ncbi:MAG: biotin-dependent carboxyltransferase family protein [Paracoccaceae bacterium]|nr:biotin-dependent carboxyltransferase family protein [Paracoccaceae bacterium]MDG1737239.1 biotin-dependent carboxyltransferase family protein [Paracoccaceae bacterium]MDG2257057.1 biotin-dependent carboxyltransferase family protein [Paracoccaceae bacterium]